MASGNNSSFSLSGLGSGFANRQRDLFACLDAADKERVNTTPAARIADADDDHGETATADNGMEVAVPSSGRKRKSPFKQFRGKESIFKRPAMPAPRRARQSVPDHQRNPHKWTKYTLGDVSPNDMSDRSNTAAALSFLQELKARKDSSEDMDVDVSSPKAIVFKPVRTEKRISSLGTVTTVSATAASEEADRPSFRSSKLVMPEYIVGQKKSSKKKLNKDSKASEEKVKKDKSKEIKLGHLMDQEDELE